MPRQPNPLTIVLLAFALFLRVWVPAGWMPAQTGGGFAIEPCPAAAMPMAPDTAHHGPSHKDQHDSDCAFAPHHAGAAAPSSPVALTVALVAAAPVAQHVGGPSFATGPPAPPPPATGPPALA